MLDDKKFTVQDILCTLFGVNIFRIYCKDSWGRDGYINLSYSDPNKGLGFGLESDKNMEQFKDYKVKLVDISIVDNRSVATIHVWGEENV